MSCINVNNLLIRACEVLMGQQPFGLLGGHFLPCLAWWFVVVGRTSLLVLFVPVPCISGKRSKADLSISSLRTIVKGPDFINKMRFDGMKSIMNLELILDKETLMVEKLLNILHEISALCTSVINETTFCADFMHTFISALYPDTISII